MIHRVDVVPTDPQDPAGRAVTLEARVAGLGVEGVRVGRVYLIETGERADRMAEVAVPLLADGVAERAAVNLPDVGGRLWFEVHPKPGVTDPVAASCEEALRRRGLDVVAVRTGRTYAFDAGKAEAADLIRFVASSLANPVIERIFGLPQRPGSLEKGSPYVLRLRHVPVRDLDAAGLARLSRDGHLFLSPDEMRAVQDYYRAAGREPTDVELETIAQTWSEHCVHKTLKSSVIVNDADGNELRRYGNLIRETIFASTRTLMDRDPTGFCLSVFVDNAGVVAFDDEDAVCFKVETHNRPSAIEPYGGAATGIGGVIRDVLGTGLGARPIANTDVFCVAPPPTPPDTTHLPAGVIPPGRVLERVVAGVRDYGNRMGIPTVNGAVYFHADYVANPLVFCGCVGVLPRDKIDKAARAGDRVVVMGGRTGRDGIHGATFSSAELTDTHAGEFAHAVQIGNAITQKKMADVLLRARDENLYSAVTDCGAGGLSSAVGEMGENLGAFVELDRVPLKYEGLAYDEIWISEAQERMVLAVPADMLDRLLALTADEDVEATDIGYFGTDGRRLVLQYAGHEVGRLDMAFLHDGIPMPTRTAVVDDRPPTPPPPRASQAPVYDVAAGLLQTLADPNVASKHRIVRQYDHEVQGGSVVKPFVGPLQVGPADAAVIRPKLNSYKGVAVACGLAPHVEDPYVMALAAIDEAVRNAICVGADLSAMALLDNFCWPGTDDARTLGTLVRACEACRDAALAYGTPFISGKDSLHNQFTDKTTGRVIRIPRTLLISAIGVLDDVRRVVTSDLKAPGHKLILVGPLGDTPADRVACHRAVSGAIRAGRVAAAHDVSDGGWLAAAAEMAIGGGLGFDLADADAPVGLFDEFVGGYVLACEADPPPVEGAAWCRLLGVATPGPDLVLPGGDAVGLAAATAAWRGG